MAQIVKYYSGTLHAQFETGKATAIYAHMNTADVELQPRFVLERPQEIDFASYEAATLTPSQPYLQRKMTERIELVFGVGTAKRVTLKELTLQWTDEDVVQHRVWTFMAEKNGRRHGRLKAHGFVAVVEEIPDIIKDVVSDSFSAVTSVQASPVVQGATNARMENTAITDAPLISAAPSPSLMSRGGCSPFRGLGSGMPGGCGRRGCGFLAIIPMLFVLLGMLRQCQESGRPKEGATIIHDTVYVDRVEERVDTLTLFKTDTIQMVDSTKQTVFKPVVLPNVQFYTNSANLIPTSLSDIQQLAQHLIDTPELDAIVIGHTDNVGEVQSNLKLSQRRAETVRNVIISMGVEANRLTAIGKGDKEPKADNNTEEGRLMNRRVEVQLVQTVINENKTTIKQ